MIHTIAVLRGGPSSEYEVSLKTGKSVIEALREEYRIIDITIDKQGVWYKDGVQVEPIKVFRGVDVVFNAMHGEYGEDGQVQDVLQSLNIPFTGPKKLAAQLSINKITTKKIYNAHGIKTPAYKEVTKGVDVHAAAAELVRSFTLPIIVKPAIGGSSLGMGIATNQREIAETISTCFEYCDTVILEEFIKGKEGTVGVIEEMREEDMYVLPVIEIIPPDQSTFFDYEAKYSGKTEEVCPGNFSQEEKEIMMHAAKEAHKALGLRHYSRTDFMVHPTRGVFALETNSLPGLTNESLLPKALDAVGIPYKDFLKHILEVAFKNAKKGK